MRFFGISTALFALCLTGTFADVSRDERSIRVQERSATGVQHARDFLPISKRVVKVKAKACPKSKIRVTAPAAPNGKAGAHKRTPTVEMDKAGKSTDEIDSPDMNACTLVLVWADQLYAAHTSIGDLDDLYALLKNVHAKITHILLVTPSNGRDDEETEDLIEELKEKLVTKVPIAFGTYPAVIGGPDASYTLSAKFSIKGKFTWKKVA